ncbi:hypothetical protein Tco_0641495 [Tanacetum coccineum]
MVRNLPAHSVVPTECPNKCFWSKVARLRIPLKAVCAGSGGGFGGSFGGGGLRGGVVGKYLIGKEKGRIVEKMGNVIGERKDVRMSRGGSGGEGGGGGWGRIGGRGGYAEVEEGSEWKPALNGSGLGVGDVILDTRRVEFECRLLEGKRGEKRQDIPNWRGRDGETGRGGGKNGRWDYLSEVEYLELIEADGREGLALLSRRGGTTPLKMGGKYAVASIKGGYWARSCSKKEDVLGVYSWYVVKDAMSLLDLP